MATDENKRIAHLAKAISRHQDLYYNAQPELTDAQFDALWDELKALAPDHPIILSLGEDKADGFPKAKHILPMGSQEKAANPDEFLSWCDKVQHPEYVVQYKMDGASLELQYKEGELERAVTRGDGLVGDDITANALRMNGVVKTLPQAFSGAVRGEVLMAKAVLAGHFPDKANCRNAANGIMKRKDGAGSDKLDVVVYDAALAGTFDAPAGAATGTVPEAPFHDELAKLAWLKDMGFSVVQTQLFTQAYEIVDYRARVAADRDKLPYDIDGLVAKGRLVDVDDMKRGRPEKQIAFKFPLEEAVASLLAVEWSESGSTYTPIGIMSPVRLAGTTVQRANLANTNTIRGMGLAIGSKVLVVKRGEIIPKIEGLVENPPGTTPIVAPVRCSCGASLVDEGTRLYCPNADCPKKALHRLEKWVSVLDIRDLGASILARLFESGRVKTIADLYTLDAQELAEYDRMGPTLAAKLVANIHARQELSLPEFLAGFDIENLGLTMLEKITQAGWDTLEKLRSADAQELAAVPGFGSITATALVQGLLLLRDQMDAVLTGAFVRIKAPVQGGSLSGLSFCFTGQLESMKRAQAEAAVKTLGASIRSSVGQGLSYLVTNDPLSGSSKNKKAAELGVAVIGEDQFRALIGKA